jgi:signal transduction histidine kinase
VAEAGAATGFRLLRYFTAISIAVFAAVAVAMVLIERAERELFQRVQADQAQFFRQTQEAFALQQEQEAQRDLLRVHEAGHVNLTRLFANVLWERDFAPFVVRAQAIDVERCRRAPEAERAGCFAAVGAAVMALPGFKAIDARVAETMQKTTVFKIKAFDLRGVTIYSSEHAQIGEDKRDNQGWKSAVAGRPASELTHRDRFSSFEGVVENRDLISSYLPVLAPGGTQILGVFEIYSDVTSLLEQVRGASARARALSAGNQRSIAEAAARNQQEMDGSSNRLLIIVGALLLFLYAALFLLARHGQAIIDRRERERAAAIVSEQRSHREKMAALGSMAANVAHEIGNPLAAISACAQELALHQAPGVVPPGSAQQILEQTRRIASMTRRIADFAAARSERRDLVDVNQTVQAVCDFMGFDRRFGATRITFRGDPALPPRALVPDHLTEVLMNLLQVCVEGDSVPRAKAPDTIAVQTERRGSDVVIRLECDLQEGAAPALPAWAQGARITATQRIVAGMDGRFAWLVAPRSGVEIILAGGELARAAA